MSRPVTFAHFGPASPHIRGRKELRTQWVAGETEAIENWRRPESRRDEISGESNGARGANTLS